MITGSDDFECTCRDISVGIKKEFKICCNGHRFQAEGRHGCLVEDGEGTTERGEVDN